MSKAILIIDIPDDKNINNIEVDYYVYDIKKHDIPFGKELLKVGGVIKPFKLPILLNKLGLEVIWQEEKNDLLLVPKGMFDEKQRLERLHR